MSRKTELSPNAVTGAIHSFFPKAEAPPEGRFQVSWLTPQGWSGRRYSFTAKAAAAGGGVVIPWHLFMSEVS